MVFYVFVIRRTSLNQILITAISGEKNINKARILNINTTHEGRYPLVLGVGQGVDVTNPQQMPKATD